MRCHCQWKEKSDEEAMKKQKKGLREKKVLCSQAGFKYFGEEGFSGGAMALFRRKRQDIQITECFVKKESSYLH